MIIDAYISNIDPSGVDTPEDVDDYLSTASNDRDTALATGVPYHYIQQGGPTLLPRATMEISTEEVFEDADYMVFTYDYPADPVRLIGKYYYFAEYIPDDPSNSLGSHRYRLRLDSWATLRSAQKRLSSDHATYVTGTLLQGHELEDVEGSEYVNQPADISHNVRVSPIGGSTHYKVQIFMEIETTKGNFVLALSPKLNDLGKLKNMISALWLLKTCDLGDALNFGDWRNLIISRIVNVWIVPSYIADIITSNVPVYYTGTEVHCEGSERSEAWFDDLMSGIVEPGTYTLSANLCGGQVLHREEIDINHHEEFCAYGNANKLVAIPAGSPSTAVLTVDFSGPVAFGLFSANPSPAQFAILINYRGEITNFADALRIPVSSIDRSQQQQDIIASGVKILSAGAGVASGFVGAAVASSAANAAAALETKPSKIARAQRAGDAAASASIARGAASAGAFMADAVTMSRQYARQTAAEAAVATIFGIDNIDQTGGALQYLKTYGLAFIRAKSSNQSALDEEAKFYGPSGAKRLANHVISVASGDRTYMRYAGGVHLKRDPTTGIPAYVYQDVESRLINGMRLWDTSMGYRDD